METWKQIKTKKEGTNQPNNKMADINPTKPIITLNLNGVNTPIKRQILLYWIQNKTKHTKNPILHCLPESSWIE